MTTGYTREQLAELSQQIYDNVPPPITADDLVGAASVRDVSMAAMDTGILLRLLFKTDDTTDFFLNCPVTLELVLGFYEAGQTHRWWLKEDANPRGFRLDPPVPEDLATAVPVVSLRTASEPKGIMVSFGGGVTASQFYMRKKIVGEVLAAIAQANDRARWWDDTMALIPNDGSSLQ